MRRYVIPFLLSLVLGFPALAQTISGGVGGVGGNPGGSPGQLQYNNAGAFAGMAGTTWDNATRTLTLTDGAGKTLTLDSNDLTFNRAGTAYVSNGNAAGSIKLGVGGNVDGLTVNSDKSVTFYGSATFGTTIKTGGYTVAGLPAGSTGMRTYVTDQMTACPAISGTFTGGGNVVCAAFYNGTAWVFQ